MADIDAVIDTILARRRLGPAAQRMPVAISGIDAAGKSLVTGRMLTALQQRSVRAVVINCDGWHHLPARRFSAVEPAEHFYQHAFRFEEMFDELVLPLQRTRSIHVVANLSRV